MFGLIPHSFLHAVMEVEGSSPMSCLVLPSSQHRSLLAHLFSEKQLPTKEQEGLGYGQACPCK